MNYGTEPLSATLSPFLSGTSSPMPSGGGFPGQTSNSGASSSQIPTTMAMAAALNAAANSNQASPALAYANAQLAHFAQQHQNQNAGTMPNSHMNNLFQGQQNNNANINAAHFASLFAQSGGALPSHLNPHALSSALTDYNSQSVPNSAASSPGQQYRRLPASAAASGYPSGTMTGHNTPGSNSRIAASSVTGKRLNWSEMICQTIAESESGRLVIQDLFEQMCAKFPEIHEWAFGKDWEGRVKNRIKSTLSIKGNMFIKVPRPSSTAGKGSWWTLSQEAQDAWKEGRVASVIKSGTHSRSASQGRVGLDQNLSMSAATSRANSRAPSRRGSPVSSRGPSSHHAQSGNQHGHTNNRNSQTYVSFGAPGQQQHQPQQQSNDSQSHSSPSVGSQGDHSSRRPSPSSGLPASLGMSPINFSSTSNNNSNNNTFDSLASSAGLEGFDDALQLQQQQQDPNAQRMRMMENSVNDSFDPSSGAMNGSGMLNTSMGMSSFAVPSGNLYSISPYNSFSTSATAHHLGPMATAAHMGGPQSMPFPHSSNTPVSSGQTQPSDMQNLNQSLSSFGGDPTYGAFAGLDLSSMDGLNNPFGSMAGGYTMLDSSGNNSSSNNNNNSSNNNLGTGNAGAQPTPIPGRNGASNGESGSGGRGTPSASSFNAAFYSGPSPADSTSSTSAFFAYTPAMQAADAAMGSSQQGSALGPVGGEGSKKKREAPTSDFALPPVADNQDGRQ